MPANVFFFYNILDRLIVLLVVHYHVDVTAPFTNGVGTNSITSKVDMYFPYSKFTSVTIN